MVTSVSTDFHIHCGGGSETEHVRTLRLDHAALKTLSIPPSQSLTV